MTNHVARLYLFAASVLGLFVAWAGIAAQPWQQAAKPAAASSPALVAYEQRLREDAALVARLVALRQTRPAAPAVRVVTLPPLTTTRTS
ncbi:MAG: hypothetical protein ACXWZB_08580 [Gaiellaceae bacterium]